jgi:hypothetical protein
MLEGEGKTSLQIEENFWCQSTEIWDQQDCLCVGFVGAYFHSFSRGIMVLDLGAHNLFTQIQAAQRLKDLCPTFDVFFQGINTMQLYETKA